uniref:Uncharacterized protein n=1 Tax=Ciona savignyi TaxID=51511 RepID=H2ZKR8_CIOSA
MATKKSDKRQQCSGFIKNSEEIDPTECLVKGCVPTWLNGDVVRIGPGEFDIGPDTFDHWFDGHAILHRFSIANGKVVYNSKFQKSKTYQKNHEHSRIVIGEFATASRPDPCKNIFQRFATKFTQSKPESDNANVNIAKL